MSGDEVKGEVGVVGEGENAAGGGAGFALEPPPARERPPGSIAPAELARLVGYTPQMVLRWMHEYGLPFTKIGGRYWIDREAGLAWCERRKRECMDPVAGGKRRRGRPSIAESSPSAPWRRTGSDGMVGDGEAGGEIVSGGLRIGDGGVSGSGAGSGGRSTFDDTGGNGGVNGGGADGALYRAKVARERAAAKKLELENAEAMGKLVPVEDARDAWAGVLNAFRGGLDALPERAVGDIMVEVESWLASGAVDEPEALRERLLEKMSELADEVRRTLREQVVGAAGASGERSAA